MKNYSSKCKIDKDKNSIIACDDCNPKCIYNTIFAFTEEEKEKGVGVIFKENKVKFPE